MAKNTTIVIVKLSGQPVLSSGPEEGNSCPDNLTISIVRVVSAL